MRVHDDSDEAVVLRARVDGEAFGILIERYEAPLRRYIQRLGVRNIDDQDDVLQNIFIKTYRYLNSFDTSLKFSTWIYRIAHNETMSWFRKRKVRPEGHLVAESEDVLSLLPDDIMDASAATNARLERTVIEAALEELDQKYRAVITLRFFEHKEYDEISDILEIPIGSVGTLLHRAKKRLADLISKKLV